MHVRPLDTQPIQYSESFSPCTIIQPERIQEISEVDLQVTMGLETVNNFGPLIALNMDQLVARDANLASMHMDLPRVVYQMVGPLQLSDSTLRRSWDVGSLRSGSDQSSCKKMKVGVGNFDGYNQARTRPRDMNVQERYFEIANALAADDELLEVPLEYKELWENLEEFAEMKKKAMLRKGKGVSSQGGGSCPSIAAREP